MSQSPNTENKTKQTSFIWELFCSTVFIRQPKDSCSSLTLQLIDDYILSDCHNHEPFIIGALSNWTLDIYMVDSETTMFVDFFLINGLLFLERAFPFLFFFWVVLWAPLGKSHLLQLHWREGSTSAADICKIGQLTPEQSKWITSTASRRGVEILNLLFESASTA